MSNSHLPPSSHDDTPEASLFARIPRPQQVLNFRPRVPTKAALMRAGGGAPRVPPPTAPETSLTAPIPPFSAINPPDLAQLAISAKPSPPVLNAVHDSPPKEVGSVSTVVLGYINQDGVEWTISAKRKCFRTNFAKRERSEVAVIMTRQLGRSAGERVERILKNINHRNIAKVAHLAWEDNRLVLGIEYCRPTLKQALHLHLKFKEPEIWCIASSVFNALSYLANRRIAHRSVGLQSIRITVKDFRIVLGKL